MENINYQDIEINVKSTDHGYNCGHVLTQGDISAYNLIITYTDIASFDGTVNLHFALGDGTYADRDASDGVVVSGNTISYTLDETLYAIGRLACYVQHFNFNIHTTLKISFSNIRALPGTVQSAALISYPEWVADIQDEEAARAVWEAFIPAKVYAVGEKAYYLGSSYIMHTASGVAGTLPTNATYWQIVAQAGDAGTITVGSTNTAIDGFVAGNGTKISAPTAAQVEALPLYPAINLVSNPGFESSLTGWIKNGTATATIDAVTVLDGTKSLKMAVSASNCEYYQALLVPETHIAFVSAWLYIEAYTSGIVSLVTSDYAASTNILSVAADTTKIGVWQRISLLRTITGTGLRAKLTVANPSTTTVIFDDIMVIDLTAKDGSGNEPVNTAQVITLLADNQLHGWFSGTINSLSTIKKLADNMALKPYQNKRIFLLGDSLTNIGDDARGWFRYFRKIMLPSSYVNLALSGAWLTDRVGTVYDGNPVAGDNVGNVIGNQVQKIINNAYAAPDIIIIFAGTNDTPATVTDADIEAQYFDGGGMIALASVVRTTYPGAIRYHAETLRGLYPNAQIFFITPPQRADATDTYPIVLNKGDIIERSGRRVSVPVINTLESGVFSNSGAWGVNQGDFYDGLHMSITGAPKLGKCIASKVIDWFSYDTDLLSY